ncbi:hypothetical protein A1O1_06397 [Capronia coronata CBS 617.96]|uniref:Uncharacterized protein n=1 Tax=Capronia coronata CBS 617.96 TaxID=1182541 RepID=W9Y0M2_9EURO|nr:uncharacterized protein A1O1_06397 [Capronia coronata CBS 617.96]EXJ86028.1 hypothetical protein A1O1_06397 [Capronia coronata CBS 617.96]
MSLVDLLFPQAELEALGNRWHEPVPKRRRIDPDVGPGHERGPKQDRGATLATSRRHNSDSAVYLGRRGSFATTRRRMSSKSHTSTAKRSNPEFKPSATSSSNTATSTSRSTATTKTTAPTAKSFLPSFIEPSILQNYLQHLHPNDRPRYTLPNHSQGETHSRSDEDARRVPQEGKHDEDCISSPGALTADTSSPAPSHDHCATPSPGIYEQLHCAPFSHLIQGLRCTEHERDMVNDLLNPSPSTTLLPAEFSGIQSKREAEQMDPFNECYHADEGYLHTMFPFGPAQSLFDSVHDSKFSTSFPLMSDEIRDSDVHSSGLSPGMEEDGEETKSPAGLVIRDYSSFGDDDDGDDGDLFDYDRAAGPPLATP